MVNQTTPIKKVAFWDVSRRVAALFGDEIEERDHPLRPSKNWMHFKNVFQYFQEVHDEETAQSFASLIGELGEDYFAKGDVLVRLDKIFEFFDKGIHVEYDYAGLVFGFDG